MRVLVSVVPGYGHLHPMLPLALALRQAGHQVAIATGPELRPRAEAAGFESFPAGLALQRAFQVLTERFPDGDYNRLTPAEILGWWVPHLFGEILAPATLPDLDRLLRTWQPDLLLHDCWEFAAPVVAAAACIPSVSQTLGLRFDDALLDLIARSVAPLWEERGLEPDPSAGLYRHLCLDIMPPRLQPLPLHSRVRPLRPVVQPPLSAETLPEWVHRRGDVPLVYMTLGTNTNSQITMFRAALDGLADTPVDLLITTGPGRNPGALGPLPANAHAEEYVAQSLLLPHCSAVICHAGAGTTLASLAAGLPLLLLPQGADQYVIADRVAAQGAGLRLAPAEVTPSSVRSSVLALLHDPAYGAAARRQRRDIAAMPGPDEVVGLLEEVAKATLKIYPGAPHGSPQRTRISSTPMCWPSSGSEVQAAGEPRQSSTETKRGAHRAPAGVQLYIRL